MKIKQYLFFMWTLIQSSFLYSMDEAITAIGNNDPQELQEIINSGKIENIDEPVNSEHFTLLHIAVLHIAVGKDSPNPQIIDILLKANANPNQRNKWGATPFHFFVWPIASGNNLTKAHLNIFQNFLKYGGNLNTLDYKIPPSSLYSPTNDLQIFSILTLSGANPFQKDSSNMAGVDKLNEQNQQLFISKPGIIFQYIQAKTLKGKAALALLHSNNYNLETCNRKIAQLTGNEASYQKNCICAFNIRRLQCVSILNPWHLQHLPIQPPIKPIPYTDRLLFIFKFFLRPWEAIIDMLSRKPEIDITLASIRAINGSSARTWNSLTKKEKDMLNSRKIHREIRIPFLYNSEERQQITPERLAKIDAEQLAYQVNYFKEFIGKFTF